MVRAFDALSEELKLVVGLRYQEDCSFAEIAAVLAQECFFSLDAPLERLAMPDIPSPHSPVLLEAAVPSVARITASLQRLASL
jgi:pyruvate/2-oxoglutarate/acetoin dehydrogenase E1 component